MMTSMGHAWNCTWNVYSRSIFQRNSYRYIAFKLMTRQHIPTYSHTTPQSYSCRGHTNIPYIFLRSGFSLFPPSFRGTFLVQGEILKTSYSWFRSHSAPTYFSNKICECNTLNRGLYRLGEWCGIFSDGEFLRLRKIREKKLLLIYVTVCPSVLAPLPLFLPGNLHIYYIASGENLLKRPVFSGAFHAYPHFVHG